MRFSALLLALCFAASTLVGCAATSADPEQNLFGVLGTELTRSQRLARVEAIRDQAAIRGFDNFWLLAGIAKCETQLAHCWSEATWACQGPASASCGGGPVIAGSGDGACDHRLGGLGIFQFDAGDYDDTLRREGRGILTLEGNIDRAVDVVTDIVVRSRFISGVSTEEEAREWTSRIRHGSAGYDEWIDTVTGYYNGCMRGSCGIYASRAAGYRRCHQEILDEMGEAFFFDASPAPTPPPPAPPPAPPARCGDGSCDSGESCSSCEADCGRCAMDPPPAPICGDGTCDASESCSACPGDCGACAPRCGDGMCSSGETCTSCSADCGACPILGCGVEGHMSTTDGGACSTPEAWRCVFSPRYGTNVSQVCRSGSWVNFHLDPRDCSACCGDYSTSCRQSGA